MNVAVARCWIVVARVWVGQSPGEVSGEEASGLVQGNRKSLQRAGVCAASWGTLAQWTMIPRF